MRFSLFILAILCFISSMVNAQTQHQNSGWLFLLNSTKLNDKWSTYLDMQFRSADKWENLKTFMFRPGITYAINNKNEVTLGYLLSETFLHLDGAADNSLTENRIWEQYIFKHKLSTISATQRFRLEQRFIERIGNGDLFSQRFRYFVKFMLPLQKGKQNFEEGFYVALQNEIFLNLQNKNELNHNFFDQNRVYAAVGYRLSKKIDVETGYLNQAVKGLDNHTVNNIIQAALYTRF